MPNHPPPSPNHPLLRALTALDRGTGYVEAAILSGSVLAMAALNIANVIGRNFGYSLPFTAEINRLLIILITFMGIGYGARQARHIRMSALSEQLRGLPAKLLQVAVQLGTAALLLLLAWFALGYVQRTQAIGAVTPSLQIPLYLIYLTVPVGLFLGAIQYALAAVRNVTTPGTHLAFNVREPQQRDQDSPL